MLEAFLLGIIVTCSATAGAFFFKFWRKTRDLLFLGFAAAFIIEGINRISFLLLPQPNEGSPLVYTVRLFSYLLILAAIVHKNRA
jgi:uncharacterized membrane protein HdeD (DUF308 family)